MISIYHKLLENKKRGYKSFAVLLDPDKLERESCQRLVQVAIESKIDFFLVGGSLITNFNLPVIISEIKSISNIPVILFPGSNLHIDSSADAILFLSLISGRNPDFLIGQHVVAAPILKNSNLEIISTGYILVDCGKQTTVSYVSNTTPIPYDKPSIAACTGMAGEMLGLKLLYLDGGSGAMKPVSAKMVSAVRKAVDIPIIVGGGINSSLKASEILNAGADMIVIGNGIEKDPNLLIEVSEKINDINQGIKRAV